MDTSLRVTGLRVARSEWIKMRSVRSTAWTLAASVVLIVGLGVLLCVNALVHLESGKHLGSPPAVYSLFGVYAAQLATGVLGVLLVTGEYATGMIRATLSAVPARLPVLWAKLAVFAAATLVTCELALLVSLLAGQSLLASRHAGASLSDPGVLRAVAGAGLYLTLTGLLGMALGFVIRSTAGALAAVVGLLLVLPVLGDLLPADIGRHVVPYLPASAGQAVMQLGPVTEMMAPWTGLGLFAAYTAAAVAAAAFVLKRRDA